MIDNTKVKGFSLLLLTLVFAFSAFHIARADITTGLVGYWNFDEGSGASAADSSGNGTAGTLMNGPAWVTGKIVQALSFNGSSQYVSLPSNPSSLDITGALTLSAWVNETANPTARTVVISKGDPALLYQYELTGSTNGHVNFSVCNSVGCLTSGTYTSSTLFSPGAWHHVVGTYDGNGNAIMYVDGTNVQAVSSSTMTALKSGVSGVWIGGLPASSRDFNGTVDDVRIYNRALSASDVAELYAYTGSSGGGSSGGGTPPPTSVDGVCGSTQNSCTAGTFSDLTDSPTQYLWSCNGQNGGSNASCSLNTPVISPPDTTPPVISTISSSAVTQTTATVSWTTNEAADSQISYGVTTIYGSQTSLNSSLVTSHSISLTGLSANTVYHYQVLSKDAAGNLASSPDNSFTTGALILPLGEKTVKQDGTGNFTTISSCVATASPGDTCTVYSGTYHETVAPTVSGTYTSPITIQAAAGNTVEIDGLNLDSSSFIWIQGFQFKSISQYGITWTFDKYYLSGLFANGDYWVQGPVTISTMTPAWDGYHNGWDVNPMPSCQTGGPCRQPYDVGAGGYTYVNPNPNFNPSAVPTLPYTASPGSSIVKTMSVVQDPSNFAYDCYHDSANRACLTTAVVLTVVGSVPPDNGKTVFRPPYVGSTKAYYSMNSLQSGLLPSLPASSISANDIPKIPLLLSKLKRVQLEHIGSVVGGQTRPTMNLCNYGPCLDGDNTNAILWLTLDQPLSTKMPLLIAMIQGGIDRYYAALNGQTWPGGFGFEDGRKITITFASIMLNDASMQSFIGSHKYQEDNSVHLGYKAAPLWGGVPFAAEKVYWDDLTGLAAENISQPDPYYFIGNFYINDGSNIADPYEVGITSPLWRGSALMGHLIPQFKSTWNNDMFFDYEDRFVTAGIVSEPDACAPIVGVCQGGTSAGASCTSATENIWCGQVHGSYTCLVQGNSSCGGGGTCNYTDATTHANNYGKTYGPTGTAGMCILDPNLTTGSTMTTFSCQPGKICGRFPQRQGRFKDNYGGYEGPFIRDMWTAFRGLAVSSSPTTYTVGVAKSGTGSGTVTSSVGAISCGTTCISSAMNSGTSMTLTAAPSGGSTFTGWLGGGCSGTGTCSITLTANTSVTATFTSTLAADTTPPTVSITSPLNNVTISNSVSVVSTASDNIGVAGVQLKLDGVNLGSELTTAPYSGTWNTTGVSNGSHTLTAIARDAAGNTKTSSAIAVTVSNVVTPPTNGGGSSGGGSSGGSSGGSGNSSGGGSSSGGGGGGGSSSSGSASSVAPAFIPTVSQPAPTVSSLPCTATTASASFTRSMTIGTTGSDVKALQQFLNTHGFQVSLSGAGSPGNETTTFGPATTAALARFQAANSISPAVGYFGPITMAKVNSQAGGKVVSTQACTTVPAPTYSAASTVSIATTGSFTRDLTLGSTGSDVQALQVFLNSHGFPIAATGPGSKGQESTYFGSLTQSALARFQAVNGIIPSVGYFGPKTRATVGR